MTAAAKRSVYSSALASRLRPPLREALVFVLEPVGAEVEACRDLVGSEDLPVLLTLYWALDGWAQRAAMLHLLSDQGDRALVPIWRDILRAPDDGAGTALHAAKSLALARLEGDPCQFDTYYADYPLCVIVAARRYAQGS